MKLEERVISVRHYGVKFSVKVTETGNLGCCGLQTMYGFRVDGNDAKLTESQVKSMYLDLGKRCKLYYHTICCDPVGPAGWSGGGGGSRGERASMAGFAKFLLGEMITEFSSRETRHNIHTFLISPNTDEYEELMKKEPEFDEEPKTKSGEDELVKVVLQYLSS